MQKKGKDRKNPWSNGPTLLLIAMCLGSGLYWFFNREPTPVPLKYGELAQILKAKDPAVRFRNVRVGRSVVTGEIDTRDIVSDGKAESARLELTRSFRTSRQGVEQDAEFIKLLKERVGREFQGEEEESALRGVYSLLMSFVLIVAVVLVGFLLFRWIAGGNSPLTFGRSRHKLYAQKDLQITFKDVAGIDEAVAELREIVDFLKSPEKYQALGGRIPKGVLLVGPPGTGKTLLAKAVAGEADVPFFSLSGSDFVEMFVGVGASRVRDLFGQAESKAPCLTGDTLVTLAGGRQVTIREMFEKDMLGVRVPAMTEDFRLKEATVIGITRKPCVDLYKITTSTSAIKATGNHLFPVLRGSGLEWVRADQLSNTDYVAVPRHIRRAANAPVVTDLRLLVDRAHPGVLWSRIRCVQRVAPVDYVYDLCLDRHHCFVSNNIITHNCIVFIDELDALGKTRGGSAIGGHDEREQTLNQLLVEMDGFDSNRGVILMAATNRPETLDAALMRPGRFDRTVVVDRPDIVGREAILRVHIRNVRIGEDVDLKHVAALTPGSVGADLANLVNEAALMAARTNKEKVDMAEFNEAVERGAVGLERKSRIMSPDEKQRVAYHEAGHALVACALPNTHPVHKVSIIPRGVGALGYVLRRPEEDRYLMTRSELESHIKVALAGTIAEELTYREISNGATSDLENANSIARSMVKEFGMSRLGRVSYRDQNGPAFLPGAGGMDVERKFSEQTAREIDMEVRKIIDDATAEVRSILQGRRAALEAVARRLIDKEVIDGGELRQLIEANDPGPKLVPGSLPVEGRSASEAVQDMTIQERKGRVSEPET